MFRLALRSLIAKKLRFVLTTLVMVVGVMFVVGTFTLTDSLRATFSGLAEDIASGADLTVQTDLTFGSDLNRAFVPEEFAELIEGVEGVAEVRPDVAAFNVFIVDGEGEPIQPVGPPALGLSFNEGQLFLTEGRRPTGPGEVAFDVATADDNNLVIGQSYLINGPVTAEQFELVGLFNFGSPDRHTSLGQTMSAFELTEAQRFLDVQGGYLDIAIVVSDDADVAEVQQRVEVVVGDGYRVVTAEVQAAEQEADFNANVDIFNTILLVFAFIAVFVAAFIINNTFQIILGQRLREIGLWRAIGATQRQVSWSVIVESVVLGILSTILGLVSGLGLATVLRWILDAIGFPLPAGPLTLQLRTVVLAIAVGLGVTVVSSIAPALRARRISPIAAINTDLRLGAAGLRRRLIVGGAVGFVGVAALAVGMFAGLSTVATFSSLGVGAILSFVGINIVSPAFAGPAASAIGRPAAKWGKVPGRLGSENAARSPRRTASTAAALMIGLSLMGLAAVVGESLKKTFLDIIDNAVDTDYYIQAVEGGFGPPTGFPAQATDDIEALDEIESVLRFQFTFDGILVEGSSRDVVAADLAVAESHIDADVSSGSLSGGDAVNALALHSDSATDLGVVVGDTVDVTFPDEQTVALTVVAVYEDPALLGNWVIDGSRWDLHFSRNDIDFAFARTAGLDAVTDLDERAALLAESRAAVNAALEDYPIVQVEDQAEFRESQEAELTSFIRVIEVLIGLSFFISLIGIINTLSLAVLERTREIGLLRSVGMSRRQLRRSIYWEALIVAVFGGLLGVGVGTVFGVATALALPDSFVQTLAIPWTDLVVFVVISAVAGLVASILPALRAGRMNILDAIAHE